jgi:excinuclease ABC subunit C
MPKGRAPDPDALLADAGGGDDDGLSPKLREILAKLPGEPGVYLMKDRRGKVIYVGKAASLKNRVRSYFTKSSDTRAFVPLLARIVGDIETVITNTEKEALLLENNLIKQHQPRFNVKLVDDKNFLVLRLDPRARYPRLEVTRRIGKDGARYFGPYHSATSCRATLSLVNRHFKLRTCTDHVLNSRKRPCLQYQIKRCDAPCVFPIPPEEYAKQVDDVSLFLEGKDQDLIARLKARMKEAAAATEYEVAASVRDQISALEKTLEAQRVVMADQRDQDVIGLYREGDAVEIVVLHVRHGKLLGRRNFSFRGQEFPTEDVLSSFVQLYYDLGAQIPDEVLLPLPIEDATVKSEWLSDKREKKCEVVTPQRGPRRQLVVLAEKNAASSFVTRRNKSEDMEAALAKLQSRLSLKRIPRRIECFDISHIQGTATVASMVVFVDGEPVKSEYRTFKVKTSANDDFASMYEVISRRFRRSKGAEENEERKGWAVPDLLVIDGGKGQLSSALAALRDAKIDTGMNGIDVVALAKERAVGPEAAGPQTGKDPVEKQPDRVFTARAKDPIALRPNSAELFLLSRVRDEAHRFAVTFHKKLRRRRTLRSALEDVPGVGQKRKRELLKAFGSLRKIREATVEELARAPGMSMAAAEAVVRYFGSAPEAPAEAEPVEEREDVAEDATAEELEMLEDDTGDEDDRTLGEEAADVEDNID